MNHQDFKVIDIGNKALKREASKTTVSRFNASKNSNSSSFNASTLEKKIDEGERCAPPTIPKELSQKIQQKRQEMKLTQKELAVRCNILQNSLSYIENGNCFLTPDNRKIIQQVNKVLNLGKLNLPK